MILKNEKVLFNGNVEDLKQKLANAKNKSFRVVWLSNKEFKFIAKVSFGTVLTEPFVGMIDGIKGYGKIENVNSKVIALSLNTTLRIELILIFVLFVVVFSSLALSQEDFPLALLLLLPVFLSWFWLIYRIQENTLFNNLKEHLKN